MEPILPNYVFQENYDKYFLFLDSEIFPNTQFNANIKSFSKKIGANDLIVKLDNLRKMSSFDLNHMFTIPSDAEYSLEILGAHYLEIEGCQKAIQDLIFEFFIYDSTNEWEFYVYLPDEIAICGCNNRIVKQFEEIIHPYEKISLEEKIEEIGMMFLNNIDKRSDYINALIKTYKF